MWLLWAVIDTIGRDAGDPASRRGHAAADLDAVRRLATGDADALAVLYDRHARPVYSLVLRIVQAQSDAEDVVQEVFSQAWQQARRYDATRGSVPAWLLTIARSRAIDRIRSRRTQPAAGRGDDEAILALPDPGRPQDEAALTNQQIDRLRVAMKRLPLLQRLAIELAYFEGLTQMEIAEKLEQPLGTVKTRVRLGLLKLRDEMQGMAE